MAALVLAHLLAVIALAASPRLHHWVHPDADDDDHDCAVVLFLHSGTVASGSVVAPSLTVPVATVFSFLPLSAAFVPSVFAACRVFEHAPPVAG